MTQSMRAGSQHTFDRKEVKAEAFGRPLNGCFVSITAKYLKPNSRDRS
ncbi:hypothetical protein [Rhodobacter calidifons]|uniref:Uncharacterized protein n=1 Tax=Rhodobacter calidifons TaxID=2715277 RepID=A0ABX0GBT3_9RHOB|nr:hypothetical protein [Rhodobacter calidifons]NHB78576.1 hypothetical protein [Rhodobacter calidifons]